MRVSIVAPALDGQIANTTGVVNMVNRIQNRNSGYSDAALFSKGAMASNNTLNNSISGATALKLDEQFEVDEAQQSSLNTEEENISVKEEPIVQNTNEENFLNPSTINSFENETNTESVPNESSFELDSIEQVPSNVDPILSSEEENMPKLFSENNLSGENDKLATEPDQKIFDQENNQDEDFEIPAFLRRQKF
jgi:cell division protein FtsZ